MLAAGLAAALVLSAGRGRSAELIMSDEVPDDLRALAADVWADFVETFEAQGDCFADVRLEPVWRTLEDRARYLPHRGVIELRVPATAGLLSDSLVHEFAHHVEHTCAAHVSLRPAFLAAQGLSSGSDWFDAPTWAETPSEQWAEAAVVAVLGSRARPRPDLVITAETAELVMRWGRGER